MQERIAKLLEEAKADHHAKLHEHQEAEMGLAQFQQHVSNLALRAMQLDVRVKTLQEVYDAYDSQEGLREPPVQGGGEEHGPSGGEFHEPSESPG